MLLIVSVLIKTIPRPRFLWRTKKFAKRDLLLLFSLSLFSSHGSENNDDIWGEREREDVLKRGKGRRKESSHLIFRGRGEKRKKGQKVTTYSTLLYSM